MAEVASRQAPSFKRGIRHRERLTPGASGRSVPARVQVIVDLEAYAAGLKLDFEARCAEVENLPAATS